MKQANLSVAKGVANGKAWHAPDLSAVNVHVGAARERNAPVDAHVVRYPGVEKDRRWSWIVTTMHRCGGVRAAAA